MSRHEEAIEAYAQAWYREGRAFKAMAAAAAERDAAVAAKREAWSLVTGLVRDDQMPEGVWLVKAEHPSDKANAVIVNTSPDGPIIRPMYRNIT